jgi:hypothetical protein
MVRNSFLLLVFVSFLFSCNRDNPDVVNATPVGETNWVATDSGKKSDELKANAANGGNPKEMMGKALQTLQDAYKASKDKVPGIGDVTVLIDDNSNLLIENKSGLSTTTTQVNLKGLDPDPTHVEILSDSQGHEFPGFRIKTLPGQPKVTVTNGGKKETLDFLEMSFAERADVQHSLAALTLATQIAQNTLPIGVDK